MGSGVSKQAHFVVSLDFTKQRTLARAADFFYTYPRITNTYANGKTNVFSLHGEYKRGVALLALPYVLTGIVLVLVAIMFNLYRYFRKGISPGADDTKDSDPGQRDRVAKGYLLFTAFLHVCILLLIGMAFGANVTIREAVESGAHAILTLKEKVDLEMLVPSTFLASFSAIVIKQGPPMSTMIGKKERDMAFNLMSINGDTFTKSKDASRKVVDSLDALNEYLKSISEGMFSGITSILLLFIIGSFLMFFGDVAPPRAHRTRVCMIILFALPLLAAWGLLAFSTVFGVAAGDFCYSLQTFHSVVTTQRDNLQLGTTGQQPDFNFFLEANLQCPTHSKFRNSFRDLNSFFDSAATSGLFNFGMTYYNDTYNKDDWTKAMKWAEEELSLYGECNENARFGGMLAYHMCGDHNASTVSAMALMWLASAGLSMLFGVLVFISSFGHPPAEYATAYEMLLLYGAPKLIRAFGDVGNALSRQATFARMASIDSVSVHGDNEAGKLQVTKSVAEAFTDCAIPVEDDYLVRIQSTMSRSKSGKLFSMPSHYSQRSATGGGGDEDIDLENPDPGVRQRRNASG